MISSIKLVGKIHRWLAANRDKRFLYIIGGASSAKSWTVGYDLIAERAAKDGLGVLAVRARRPAVKKSCWKVGLDWIDKCDLRHEINKSELEIRFPSKGFYRCDGLDNVFKMRSMEGVNIIWIEEAAAIGHDVTFTERDIEQLNILCRAENRKGRNQLIFTFNPVDPLGNVWLKKRSDNALAELNKDAAALKVTYLDNPFLSEDEKKQIEKLQEEDEEYDTIYRKGEWATPRFLIYTNWDIVNDWPERWDEVIWGLDFGYAGNPAALIELRFVGDKDVYGREHIYQTGLTNPQLIEMMQFVVSKSEEIIADSAEPKSIQEIRNAGYNIFPCEKGPDSVRFGIKTVKTMRIHILADSINLIKEKQGYKWKQRPDGTPSNEPLKYNDHLMDAERYAIGRRKKLGKAGISFVDLGEKDEGEDDDW